MRSCNAGSESPRSAYGRPRASSTSPKIVLPLDMEVGQEKAPYVPVQLMRQGFWIVLEAGVYARTKEDLAKLEFARAYCNVELERALQRARALGIAWIGGELATALLGQHPTRQVLVTAWHLALQHPLDDQVGPLRKTQLHSRGGASHRIDRLLRDDHAGNQLLLLDHVTQQVTLLEMAPEHIDRLGHYENTGRLCPHLQPIETL